MARLYSHEENNAVRTCVDCAKHPECKEYIKVLPYNVDPVQADVVVKVLWECERHVGLGLTKLSGWGSSKLLPTDKGIWKDGEKWEVEGMTHAGYNFKQQYERTLPPHALWISEHWHENDDVNGEWEYAFDFPRKSNRSKWVQKSKRGLKDFVRRKKWVRKLWIPSESLSPTTAAHGGKEQDIEDTPFYGKNKDAIDLQCSIHLADHGVGIDGSILSDPRAKAQPLRSVRECRKAFHLKRNGLRAAMDAEPQGPRKRCARVGLFAVRLALQRFNRNYPHHKKKQGGSGDGSDSGSGSGNAGEGAGGAEGAAQTTAAGGRIPF